MKIRSPPLPLSQIVERDERGEETSSFAIHLDGVKRDGLERGRVKGGLGKRFKAIYVPYYVLRWTPGAVWGGGKKEASPEFPFLSLTSPPAPLCEESSFWGRTYGWRGEKLNK